MAGIHTKLAQTKLYLSPREIGRIYTAHIITRPLAFSINYNIIFTHSLCNIHRLDPVLNVPAVPNKQQLE